MDCYQVINGRNSFKRQYLDRESSNYAVSISTILAIAQFLKALKKELQWLARKLEFLAVYDIKWEYFHKLLKSPVSLQATVCRFRTSRLCFVIQQRFHSSFYTLLLDSSSSYCGMFDGTFMLYSINLHNNFNLLVCLPSAVSTNSITLASFIIFIGSDSIKPQLSRQIRGKHSRF